MKIKDVLYDPIDAPRPIWAFGKEYSPSFEYPFHTHDRAQLEYACEGSISVHTETASFIVSPSRAIWIPAGVPHKFEIRDQKTSFRSLYIDTEAYDTTKHNPQIPSECCIINVSNLLKELIIEAVRIPEEYDDNGRDGRLVRLMVDEISRSSQVPNKVPMPSNERLAALCYSLISNPADNRSVEEMAASVGMGLRTFTRQFRKETGMRITTWHQNVRLMIAVSKLAEGHSVTTIAFDVGYNSSSAFTALFKRTFGMAPKEYCKQNFWK